jgi:hypothetical protein
MLPINLDNLTYPHPNIRDFTLDDILSASGFPPENGPAFKLSKTNLGTVDVFPLEFLQMVLSQLDLRTLTDFRRVNQLAMEIVDSLLQYKAITTYAPNALRGILSIETGRWISCDTLYEKLCTAECEQCGDFGGYLYILTCRRVCFLCLSNDSKYLPLSHSEAIRKFGLDRSILNTLPQMRSIPGTYSPNEQKCNKRPALVDSESAYHAGITLHGSLSAMQQYVSDIAAQKLREYDERVLRSKAEGCRSTPRRPRTEDIFHSLPGNPLRFVAVIRTPWFNRASRELVWGFHCIGCKTFYSSRPLHWRRKFTVESFIEHIEQCGNIENGEHSSAGR